MVRRVTHDMNLGAEPRILVLAAHGTTEPPVPMKQLHLDIFYIITPLDLTQRGFDLVSNLMKAARLPVDKRT